MAYDTSLAARIREYLEKIPKLKIEEKKMFRGVAFMINGKMCVNVSGDNLMCRFDPALTNELAEKTGYLPMIMKGKEMKGYCYVEPAGLKKNKDLQYWIDLALNLTPWQNHLRKRPDRAGGGYNYCRNHRLKCPRTGPDAVRPG